MCAKISMDETDMQNYTMHTAQRLKAENGETEKCQGVYLPSDDRTRLTYIYTFTIGSKVGASKWIHLVNPFLALSCN